MHIHTCIHTRWPLLPTCAYTTVRMTTAASLPQVARMDSRWRDWFSGANGAGPYIGLPQQPPTHTSPPFNQPNSGVINNTPSITLCTQMGRQVEGWWRTALCVVLHPVIQIRVWTSDSAPPPPTFTLLPHAICILQVSFHCRRCHLSLQGPAEDSLKKKKNTSGGTSTLILSDLWSAAECLQCCGFYSVLLEEYQSLWSCQSKPQWAEVSLTCNWVLYITPAEAISVCHKSKGDTTLGDQRFINEGGKKKKKKKTHPELTLWQVCCVRSSF